MASKLGDSLKFSSRAKIALWLALVAVGICGRLWQPAYNVTPFAAIGLAAGSLFGISLAAAAVPIVALVISNMVLPGYGSTVMTLVIYASLACPILFGSLVQRQGWVAVLGGSLASSLIFFTTTNFATWALSELYPHTLSGLTTCYIAALPFYRWMPVGDAVWSISLFSSLVAVGRIQQLVQPVQAIPVTTVHQQTVDRLTDEQRGRQ
ncbi:MAG: hypothetical protein P8J43_00975 [Pirellulales bacterium]|nr:hypothetical protein [Pirellulales bacterium]|tara:strand:- start:94 stop:717 length:624 start_codon:yes stop_codon:yes gene_type:complete